MKIVTVVGARPQFIKASAISKEIQRRNAASTSPRIEEILVHTGQHYDANMSDVFFSELEIPLPKHHLGVGSGRHGSQTGEMLGRIEKVLLDETPDAVMVYGDTNSTLAGALAASKLHQPVVHVEAGLRSHNRRMPEEINRVVADHLSALLLCPTETAVKNLAQEGITRGVHLVGDVMQDVLFRHLEAGAKASRILDTLGLLPGRYSLATIHRAENTDEQARLDRILGALEDIAASGETVVLPAHPRIRKLLANRVASGGSIQIVDPVGYEDMVWLQRNARLILTDSGGIQKEAFWLDVPCAVLREETEWVETVAQGSNRLVGADRARILEAFEAVRDHAPPASAPRRPERSAAERHLDKILELVKLP